MNLREGRRGMINYGRQEWKRRCTVIVKEGNRGMEGRIKRKTVKKRRKGRGEYIRMKVEGRKKRKT